MNHFALRHGRVFAPIVAISRWLLIGCVLAFAIYTGLRGISESWDNEAFPEVLALKLERLPLIFPLHMITGGLALLFVPLTIALRGTGWHKIAGRATSGIVFIAGITAIPVALKYPVTTISALGFMAQGVTWMVLLTFGLWHIRHKRVRQHYSCMMMMAAVTSGALFFRLWLGLWKPLGAPQWFEVFYACNAWVAWGLPLLITAAALNRIKRLDGL
jgi:Predicted membrane protein (DUF2306)